MRQTPPLALLRTSRSGSATMPFALLGASSARSATLLPATFVLRSLSSARRAACIYTVEAAHVATCVALLFAAVRDDRAVRAGVVAQLPMLPRQTLFLASRSRAAIPRILGSPSCSALCGCTPKNPEFVSSRTIRTIRHVADLHHQLPGTLR